VKPYYQDDSCAIYHGDCREILPTLEDKTLCITDPPYEIVAAGGGIGATLRSMIASQQEKMRKENQQ
jgi:DNA modification methylase